MLRREADEEVEQHIDMTPMVDVVFQLMTFLLLSSQMTGGEIVNEFLMSTGYLQGAHQKNCPTFKKVASLRPAWMRGKS